MNPEIKEIADRINALVETIVASEMKDYLVEVMDSMKAEVDNELDDLGAELLQPIPPIAEVFKAEANELVEKYADFGMTMYLAHLWFSKNPKFRSEPTVKKVFGDILVEELEKNYQNREGYFHAE